jgi:hypothetical protein
LIDALPGRLMLPLTIVASRLGQPLTQRVHATGIDLAAALLSVAGGAAHAQQVRAEGRERGELIGAQ